ncbi:MAG: SDR family NAD(P)-dependent oxidoreductase [Actinomycetota bacterium]|nr:SDR family NAD(P)-dependent oxidoreductase [Actinomycetota bacterium]
MDKHDRVTDWLIARIAELLDINAASITPDAPFSGLGLSSMQAVELSDDLQRWTGLTLPPTLTYDYPTIGQAAAFVVGHPEWQSSGVSDVNSPAQHLASGVGPIAIIGIGCRFPGADDPERFWQLLCDGIDAVHEVPTDRWDADTFYDPNLSVPGKMNTRWGGFLDDVDSFDADFFGISAREAARMDPQQRIVLEVAWEALHDAGVAPGGLAGSQTGVFMGVSTFDHGTALLSTQEGFEAYDGTGSALSIVANRLSYCLNLHGPSMAIDTACSSSLVAIHMACQALRANEADLAIAGGVNVITSPRIAQSFSAGGLMASDGRCKPFDHRADGYVRSEGAGVVVLKPLSRALDDGDRIYAVVMGGAVNQDGRTNGLTAPNRPAQEAVLAAAYQAAGIDPADVDYVEAHGTGTAVGDPIEVAALASVLVTGQRESRPLLIGSVKSNVGHLEAAAGVTGLIKAALVLHHRRIPPTIHFERPNPLLGLDRLPIDVPSEVTALSGGKRTALVGVSSFGFGGTNSHVVLAAAPQSPQLPTVRQRKIPFLLPLSARSQPALIARAKAWAEYASARTADASWSTCAAAAAALRSDHDRHRIALVAEDAAEIKAGMAAIGRGERPPGASGPRTTGRRAPRVALVFPGQGSQWSGMGRQLAASVPAFRAAIRRCDAAIARYLGRSLWSDEDGLVAEGTAAVQPALFTIQVALAQTWLVWGLEPAAAVGHSMGEIAAAHISGALSLDDAARIVCERSRLLAEISGKGGLAMVELDMAEAGELVIGREHELSVAAANGPRATVLAGTEHALDDVLGTLDERGVFSRRIAVEVAGHSPQVEPLQPRLRAALEGLAPGKEAIPLYSTVTGELMCGMDLGPGYWVTNLRAPVLFASAVECLIKDGYDAFLEIAPHPVLGRSIAEAVREAGHDAAVLSSMRRDGGEPRCMLGALGDYYTLGGQVDWAALHGVSKVPHVDLPRHQWGHTRFPIARVGAASKSMPGPLAARKPGRLIADRIRVGVDPTLQLWTVPLDLDATPELADHVVEDVPIVPAAYWLTSATEAASESLGTNTVVLEDVNFDHPRPVSADGDLQLALRSGGERGARFTITSLAAEGPPVIHAEGTLRASAPDERPVAATPETFAPHCAVEASVNELYERLGSLGVRYGERFRGLAQLRVGKRQAVARVRMPAELGVGRWPLHPALLDACLHTVAAATDQVGGGGGLPLPAGVKRVWARGLSTTPDSTPVREGWCYARIVSSSASADRDPVAEIVADVMVVDDAGEPIWEATGFRARLIAPQRKPENGRLYDIVWRPVAQTPSRKVTGSWLVIADEVGLGQALATRIIGAGAQCIIPGSNDESALADVDGELTGVIDTRALGGHTVDAHTLDDTTSRVLRLAKAMVNRPWPHHPPRLWLLTAISDATLLAGATLWGLGRTIANEHPEWGCSIVDLESPANDLNAVCSVLGLAEPPSQLAVRQGQLVVPRLGPLMSRSSTVTAIRSDSDYVITGGLSVLGRYVAQWLVAHGARHLTLIGRSAASTDAERELAALRAHGVNIRLELADIADAAQLDAVLRRDNSRPIAGVFHLAGVLEDALVVNLEEDALRRALAGKAVGAWHLHELTKDEPVELFVLFSSLAGLLGSPGQAAYAAANTFLDALARHRCTLGLPAQSISWGPWAGARLAVAAGGEDRLAGRGVLPLDPAAGMDLFDDAVRCGRAHLAAAAFAPQELGRAGAGPAAAQLLEPLILKGTGEAAVARGSARDAVLAFDSASERRRAMSQFLADQVAMVLRAPVVQSPAQPAVAPLPATNVPFQDLGFDSLMVIELRDRLQLALDLRLSATLVYAHPTADALADALLERLEPAGQTPSVVEPLSEPSTPAAEDDLSELDEEQVAVLLAAELDALEGLDALERREQR